ncbi:DUF1775 domain-containing protein [Arthrobacter sp. CAU 1506]|nr:DUF1775 domain-containing protein [Arthrobacter sp. CAU 1506]
MKGTLVKTINRITVRTALAAGATAGLLAVGAGAASAHVHVTPEDNAAGGSSVLTFAFAHGCEGSPTTKIGISLPEQLVDATPTVHPGWDVEKVSETLDTPKTLASGATVTERVSQVVFTAKEPVADGLRDTLQLQVLLPETAGETLAFPVLQTCEKGETNWAELPAEGQDPHDLESPAPSFVIGEAAADGHGEHDGGASAGAEATGAPGAEGSGISAAAIAGWTGLGAGVLGLAAGVTALARTRQKG